MEVGREDEEAESRVLRRANWGLEVGAMPLA
jgi:hypothetical protein